MSSQVLVYLDEGVCLPSFRLLMQSVQAELSPSLYTIHAVGHRDLIEKNWEERTALLIMPGGRDVYYHSQLQGIGNQRISSFVSNGGKYLGICAGGYYGSAYVEFEKEGELEVCGERELAFFPGRAVGPAYGLGLYSYQSQRGALHALLSWEGGHSYTYYNGGCFFERAEEYVGVEVLARYHDLLDAPAAVIESSVGKGRSILCGTHPEFSLDSDAESSRLAFWRYLLTRLS